MIITNIVMDFDGTCTVIPEIFERFLAQYLSELNKTVFKGTPVPSSEWTEAQQFIKLHSPQAGWTIAGPPAAPAAADPYILAYETAQYLLRKKRLKPDIPVDVFRNASTDNSAPWRSEARTVFESLLKHNVRIIFVSNSSSAVVTERLKSLFSAPELPQGITVQSGAEKYRISELAPDSMLPEAIQEIFRELPATHHTIAGLNRPLYLRRGPYFEAICRALGNDLSRIKSTVFCGDIWEMDLAMPYILGAGIHLIKREFPFDTYDYEEKAALSSTQKGKASRNLNGLLEWLTHKL